MFKLLPVCLFLLAISGSIALPQFSLTGEKLSAPAAQAEERIDEDSLARRPAVHRSGSGRRVILG